MSRDDSGGRDMANFVIVVLIPRAARFLNILCILQLGFVGAERHCVELDACRFSASLWHWVCGKAATWLYTTVVLCVGCVGDSVIES